MYRQEFFYTQILTEKLSQIQLSATFLFQEFFFYNFNLHRG